MFQASAQRTRWKLNAARFYGFVSFAPDGPHEDGMGVFGEAGVLRLLKQTC